MADTGKSGIDILIEQLNNVGSSSSSKRQAPGEVPAEKRSYAVGDLNTRFPAEAGFRVRDVVYDIEAGVAAVASRYREGDEWRFTASSPEDIASIQRMLDAAGLLTGDFALGVWDNKTASAMKQVLAYANRSGLTWQAALQRMASGGAALKAGRRSGGGGGVGRVFAPQVSNPEELKSIFKQASYTLLGGKSFIDDATLDRMVTAYQQEEIRAQREAFNRSTAVAPPSPQTFAEQQIEQTDPKGVEAARFASYVSVLDNLIGGA